MIWLILGVLLWSGAHLFKRLAPSARANLGDKGKGLVALALLVAVVLMVIGYRAMDFIPVYDTPYFLIHLNNLLMVFALYLTSPGPGKGALLYKMRHPMLTGFKIWAVAHLLVNGDLASLILFGGLLAWAVIEVVAINRSEPKPQPNAKGSLAKDGMFLLASLILLVVIGYIHGLIGPSPFPG